MRPSKDEGERVASDLPESVNAQSSTLRKLLGVLSAVAVVVALAWPVFWGSLFFHIALTPYDNAGSGGPFASCTVDSTSCSDPNVLLAVLLGVLLLAAVFLPAVIGQVVGRFQHRAVAIVALSVTAVLGYAICSIALLTIPAPFR